MKPTKKVLRAVQEIRDLKRRTTVHDLTFIDGFLNQAAKKKAQAELKQRLDLWWDTWIEPELRVLEGKSRYEPLAERETHHELH